MPTQTHSLETLPGLYWNQSTLPAPTFHSSPRAVSNSDSVSPGGSLLTNNLSLGAGGLGALLDPPEWLLLLLLSLLFRCVAAAEIWRTPPPDLPAVGCMMKLPMGITDRIGWNMSSLGSEPCDAMRYHSMRYWCDGRFLSQH